MQYTLSKYMEQTGCSRSDIAAVTGISRQLLHHHVHRKPEILYLSCGADWEIQEMWVEPPLKVMYRRRT